MFGFLKRQAPEPIEPAPIPQRRTYRPQSGAQSLQRGYDAAEMGRLTEDWFSPGCSADQIIGPKLERIRNRCRDLERNDDYVRKFAAEVEANIVGHAGTTLCMKINDSEATAFKVAIPDKRANHLVEVSWWKWGKRANASASKQISWQRIECMAARRRFLDGEIFIRKIKGARNPYGYALQMIEADYVPLDFNQELGGGRRVRLGIEFNEWAEPMAYYIYSAHPVDGLSRTGTQWRGKWLERVDASEIIHYFVAERPDQVRGVPEIVSCIMRLRQLKGYEDAEVVAARVCASKMGFFYNELGEKYKGDGTDLEGVPVTDAEPGTFANIGAMKFQPYDPTHPNGNYEGFRKAVLRGIASGMGVSYNMLASDLEGVNYSSLRGGLLDEREMWMLRQAQHHELLCNPVFEGWLEMAIISGQVALPIAKLEKFLAYNWVGRRWKGVDPAKETQAHVMAMAHGLTSRRRICAELGIDIEEVDQENADDKAREKALGLEYGEPEKAPPTAQPEKEEEGEEEEKPPAKPPVK